MSSSLRVAMGPLTIARPPGQTLTVRDRQRAPRAGVRTASVLTAVETITLRPAQVKKIRSFGAAGRGKVPPKLSATQVAHEDRTVCLYPILNDSGGREGSVLHNSSRQRRLQGSGKAGAHIPLCGAERDHPMSDTPSGSRSGPGTRGREGVGGTREAKGDRWTQGPAAPGLHAATRRCTRSGIDRRRAARVPRGRASRTVARCRCGSLAGGRTRRTPIRTRAWRIGAEDAAAPGSAAGSD